MHSTRKDRAGRAPGSNGAPGSETLFGASAVGDGAEPIVTPGRDGSATGRAAETEAAELDPFDPARLRLSQDFAAAVGVRKLLTTVPVRKPDKTWFVRTHPDPSYRLQTGLLRLKEDRETYLVDPDLWAELASETTFGPGMLITSISRQGVVFLWEIPLPGSDGKMNPWHQSALDAAEHAKTRWVRVSANMSLGAYDVAVAPAQAAEPDWPDVPMREILKVAFRDRRISSWDHPVLQRLRGEV